MGKQSSLRLPPSISDCKKSGLEMVLDGLPVAAFWASLSDARIVFVNRKFKEMFGYELGDHATVTEWISDAYPNAEQRQGAETLWLRHFQAQAILPLEIAQVEVDVLCKDSSLKTVLLSGTILPEEGWAVAIFNDITERKAMELRAQRHASEDALTGLFNRRAFDEELARRLRLARRQQEALALMMLDLDGFKALNDSLGHAGGDRALQVVAERLRGSVRSGDTVCRLGGDEFAVLLGAPEAGRIAPLIAARVLSEIGRPCALDGRPIRLQASLGIAIYPRDADNAQALFRQADEALYRAKKGGRGRWSL